MFSRYNGENGLVGGMKVWECKSKDGLEDYLKATRTCNRVVPQCQVGFCLLVLIISIFSSSTEAALRMGSRQWWRSIGCGKRDQSGARPLSLASGLFESTKPPTNLQSIHRWSTILGPGSSRTTVVLSYITTGGRDFSRWGGFLSPQLMKTLRFVHLPAFRPRSFSHWRDFLLLLV